MSSPFTDLPGSNGGGAGRRRPERFLCRPLLRPRLLPELLLDRLGHEVLHGDLVRHAVKLEATVKVFGDAGRQLRDGFVALGHHRSIFRFESTGKRSAVQRGRGRREASPARAFDTGLLRERATPRSRWPEHPKRVAQRIGTALARLAVTPGWPAAAGEQRMVSAPVDATSSIVASEGAQWTVEPLQRLCDVTGA